MYEEEDTCMYVEEDTCMYEEEDTCMSCLIIGCYSHMSDHMRRRIHACHV
jgi:hypothetical protein